MKQDKKYYREIDLIRVLACLAILLYHMNIIKGGYLAVCTFFTLSGYLSYISAANNEQFKLTSYYINRFFRLYLPLCIMVFSSIALISICTNFNWVNLKPETTSVLFGYNNFWQINANLDYFTRNIHSPFMHLWYISILLQFDLVFPFFYLISGKITKKSNQILACIMIASLAVIGLLCFIQANELQSTMVTYYHTCTRMFSLLFGLLLGMIHTYYGSLIPSVLTKNGIRQKLFYAYLFLLLCFYIFVQAGSSLFAFSMIAVTLISCRLIDYGTALDQKPLVYDPIIRFLANISYGIYLFQYPFIFLFQYLEFDPFIQGILVVLLSVACAYLLSICLRKQHMRFIKISFGIQSVCFAICLYGGYCYAIAVDHSQEMKMLETQMIQNAEMMQEKQEAYALRIKQQEDERNVMLAKLEYDEKELDTIVQNLSLTGIGDSVMLGALDSLYTQFPNGYFDAQTSRTAWVINGILQDLKNNNLLGDPIILNLGTNGDCPLSCKVEIMDTCENRDVFWVNVPNDNEVHVNQNLLSLAAEYDNLHIIDWYSVSMDHSEYFVSDGIHLTEKGKEVYTKCIYEAIYQTYLEKYQQEKAKIIDQYEQEQLDRISFFGNALLLNAYGYLEQVFPDDSFMVQKQFDYQTLQTEIANSIQAGTLMHKVVFVFDSQLHISASEFQMLMQLCDGHELYIISTDEAFIKEIMPFEKDHVTIMNFYEEIQKHEDYLMVDGIHLSEKGNQALSEGLITLLKQ